jgi:hypothetical protein
MEMQQTKDAFDYVRTFAPIVTGGLAGSILTYSANLLAAKKRAPRLTTTERTTSYSIPSEAGLQNIRVTYNGKAYEKLAFYSLSVANVSQRSTDSTPFLLTIPEGATVVDASFTIRPVNRSPIWKSTDEPRKYNWDPGELKPGDSADVRLLLTTNSAVEKKWRGSDDVRILAAGDEGDESILTAVRVSALWIAVYVAAGAEPYVSAFIRAGLIVLTVPFLLRWVERWRRPLTVRKRQEVITGPIVVTGPDGAVSISHDPVSGHFELDVRA